MFISLGNEIRIFKKELIRIITACMLMFKHWPCRAPDGIKNKWRRNASIGSYLFLALVPREEFNNANRFFQLLYFFEFMRIIFY